MSSAVSTAQPKVSPGIRRERGVPAPLPRYLITALASAGSTRRVYTTLTHWAQSPGVGTAAGMDVRREQTQPPCAKNQREARATNAHPISEGWEVPWETLRPQHKPSEHMLSPPCFLKQSLGLATAAASAQKGHWHSRCCRVSVLAGHT